MDLIHRVVGCICGAQLPGEGIPQVCRVTLQT